MTDLRGVKNVLGGVPITSVGGSAPTDKVTGTLWLDTGAAAISPQPLSSDLTAIAALSPANDDFIQRKSGVWVNRTLAQVRADIATATAPVTYSGGVIAIPAAAGPSTNGYLLGADKAKIDALTMYNQIVNPGFEVKQRTAATFTANGVVTMDRWVLLLNAPSTVTVSQITSTVGYPGKSAQLAYTHGSGGYAALYQNIEHYLQFQGKPITFAVTVKASAAARVHLYVSDGVTATYSAGYNVGTGEERLTVTMTPGVGTTILQVAILCDLASATVEANDVTLVVGSYPAAFAPLNPTDDLDRCERFYQLVMVSARFFSPATNALMETPVPYRVRMPSTPGVVTIGSDGFVSNLAATYPQVVSQNAYGARFLIAAAAAGDTFCVGRTVTLEYNP